MTKSRKTYVLRTIRLQRFFTRVELIRWLRWPRISTEKHWNTIMEMNLCLDLTLSHHLESVSTSPVRLKQRWIWWLILMLKWRVLRCLFQLHLPCLQRNQAHPLHPNEVSVHHLDTYLSVRGHDNIFCKRKQSHYNRHASQWYSLFLVGRSPFCRNDVWYSSYSTGKTTGGRNKERRRVIRELEGEVHNPSFQQLIQIASSTINQNETTRDSNAKRRHKRNVRIRCKSSVKLRIDYAS